MTTLKIHREIEFDADKLKDMCIDAGFPNTLLDYDYDWLRDNVTEISLYLYNRIKIDEPETKWVGNLLSEMLKIDGVNNISYWKYAITSDSYKIRLLVRLDGILYNEYGDRVR